jgi:quercetin dioxygenase-like cupin family protein
MNVYKLEDMKSGWFIGNFEPSIYKTNNCEVAVKNYKKGDREGKHYHKIATEYTLVVKGKVKMFDNVYVEGDIVVVEPGDITDFEALEDTANVVVKIPGANNDKYLVEE